jgi:predicted nucleic acid-binding protein
VAKKGYFFLKDNCNIVNEFDIVNFKDKVMDIYNDYDTKLSFTDSAIIEIMKEYNIDCLVSFDELFDKVNEIKRIF